MPVLGCQDTLGCCSPQHSREQRLEWRHRSLTNWCVLLLLQPHFGSTRGYCTQFSDSIYLLSFHFFSGKNDQSRTAHSSLMAESFSVSFPVTWWLGVISAGNCCCWEPRIWWRGLDLWLACKAFSQIVFFPCHSHVDMKPRGPIMQSHISPPFPKWVTVTKLETLCSVSTAAANWEQRKQ